jgi:sugar lactone lactonase YvrE
LRRFTAQPFFDPGSEALRFLPEGPRVLPERQLGWVAIQHGADCREGSFNLLDLSTRRNRSFPLPGRPGFFAETTRPGVLLVGLERRLVHFNLETGDVAHVTEVTSDERVIINDGQPVEGGVIFGTKHLDFTEPVAELYFYESATGRVRTLLSGQTCSNGKFLRGDILIDIDSTPKTVSRYRFDAKFERLTEQSLVVDPDSLPGFPDGLRPAPDGESVIVAFYNPAEVADGVAQQIRIADGAVLCEWTIPGAPRVTCPEFMEIDGRMKLIFTTAVEGMPDATRRLAPGSGSMYIADTPFT